MFDLANIVAPLDYSSCSRWALGVADFLARAYSATVHGIHVVPKMYPAFERVLFPYAAMGEDLPEMEAELIQQSERDLRAALGASEDNGTAPPQRVVCGPIHESVVAETLRVGPDLTVLGCYGESGSRARQLGSTAAFVLDSWGGRTFLVREVGTRDKPLTRIVVATDFGAGAESLLTLAIGLAVRTHLPLSIVTVVEDPRHRDSAGLVRAGIRDFDAWLSKGKKNSQRQMERVMAGLAVPFPHRAELDALKPEVTTLFGDPVDEVVQLLSQLEAPLLVVGRGQRRPGNAPVALGRTAEHLARRAPAHVLVAPLS